MTYTIGQRWISNSESKLGLGIITDLSRRQVNISFPAADEERIYAIENAPLSRIIFKEGDEITTNNDRVFVVTGTEEEQGIIVYTSTDESGKPIKIKEVALSCFIRLNTPQQRLFSGLIDKLNSYLLRIETLSHVNRLQQSTVKGLLGARTNHLPHQVFIANEVAQRYAPRVLLADEVGLGKTIEAGLIMHYQLYTGRANRVLVIVPDALIHQWLVEMLRRFNLHFSIFDQNRFGQIRDDEYEFDNNEPEISCDNLFETEQLVLCSLNFLMEHEEARKQVLETSWDLLVVDEAHHLHWSTETVSSEYSFIEELSKRSKGLLLLTATPEQAGMQSHFARLRLLDPSRFYDFSKFKDEEHQYQAINKLVQELVSYQEKSREKPLDKDLVLELKSYIGEDVPPDIDSIIKVLLDRHGTGRVLFRNTRAAIKGFPERVLHPYALANPELYQALSFDGATSYLYPETNLQNPKDWLAIDPRVVWLSNKIQELYPQKVLVICAKATTALALEHHLKFNNGIRTTAFHEGLSIIDRDRAAAYFAEEEHGAQALICSEIGSEGRNFQFAHHLILFDLPLNPDLLEQRIGRLDRIGQGDKVSIHVPYLTGTCQERLFRWYHEGLNLFKKSCSIGYSLFERFENQLLPVLFTKEEDPSSLDTLIDETQKVALQINKALNEGRDKLLEINSCYMPKAEELIAEIEAEENNLELERYMAKIYQEYGVDHEYHSSSTEVLRPTDHMKSAHFPGLKEDGITVTYSRLKALVREDIEFLSWEHPIVSESMDMVLESEVGNATVTTISIKSIPPGTLFLESYYSINCVAPKYLQIDTFLPIKPIRILMDVSGKNLSKILSFQQLNEMCEPVKRHLSYQIIKQIQTEIESIISRSNHTAEHQMMDIVSMAAIQMEQTLTSEVVRLEALKKVNPSIRKDEIDFFKQLIVESKLSLSNATLKLQGLRVVINK